MKTCHRYLQLFNVRSWVQVPHVSFLKLKKAIQKLNSSASDVLRMKLTIKPRKQ